MLLEKNVGQTIVLLDPFGGISLVVFGDPLDLPPSDYVNYAYKPKVGEPGEDVVKHDYPFRSKVWVTYLRLQGENFKFSGETLSILYSLRKGDAQTLKQEV